ncbi:hypothetical protein [Rickettsiella endosymbiont of Aleochara curtula]|uniref:hypothetical protein n=1 Tax=Rickettsiella endosymbiont of Aleochara curtula TaxID=3077936 RepID=UPI00313B03F9
MNIKIKEIKKALEILILVTKISFAIGFFGVTFYFFGIGYFPIESNYSIIFHLISTMAFAIIYIFMTMLALFVFPPIIWKQLVSMPDVFYWWNKKNSSALDAFNAGNFDFDFNIKLRIIARYVVYSSLNILIIAGIVFYAKPKGALMSLVTSINIILVGAGIFCCPHMGKRVSKDLLFTLKEKIIIYFKIICITSTSCIFLILSICFFLLSLLKNPSFHEFTQHESYLLFIAILFVFASGVCIVAPKNQSISHTTWILGVGIFFSAIVCFACNLPFILSTLLSDLNLASSNDTLQIDNVACQALREAQYPIKCNQKRSKYFLHNVNVKWRSGEYYIVFKSGNETHRITIPSAHIYSADSVIKDNRME